MAPRAGSAAAASARGHQQQQQPRPGPGVQEGAFLQFLRSVGYREELPPSTVVWLESAPVFKFLASRLSADNFVSAEEQQEYNEVVLARGPNSELYDALGGSSSEDDADDGSVGHQAGEAGDGEQWLLGAGAGAAAVDVQQQLEAQDQYVQHLEKQVSALRALVGELEGSNRAARARQPLHVSLQARAGQRLAAARAEAAAAGGELDGLLRGLAGVCSELGRLAEQQPQQWLLCAADLGEYGEQDEAARQLFERAMRLLNAAGEARQLDPGASPAAGAGALGGSPSGKGGGDGGVPSALIAATPRPQQHKQPAAAGAAAAAAAQQAQLVTPRGRGGRTNRADALFGADIRRHADQEARNAALLRELARQRLAFKLALDDLLKAEVAEAGTKAQLAAARDVHSGGGGFARLRGLGPACLQQLSAEVASLEERRQLLGDEEVPALTEDLARLNDTYIVAGDYDRQLHKMALAAQRKQAVLHSLLAVTSRHLLLLLLGSQEQQRLAGLQQELQDVRRQLQGHAEACRARIDRYAAVQHALQQSQQRSNLQQDDSYLAALLAAAEGSMGPPPDEAPSSDAQGATDAAEGEPATPAPPSGGAGGPAVATPRSARTPHYLPVKQLADQLGHIAAGLQQGGGRLQQLLQELPRALEQHAAAGRRLHSVAFPPGHPGCAPLVAPQHGGALAAGAAAGGAGGGSSCSASAPPSVRSARSTATHSSGGGSHAGGAHAAGRLLPALRVPEVAEAQAALEGACRALGADLNRLVSKQNECAMVLMHQQRAEQELERSVMGLFFTRPEALPPKVAALRAEVEALQLAAALGADEDEDEGGDGEGACAAAGAAAAAQAAAAAAAAGPAAAGPAAAGPAAAV